jgi:DNA-binding GntR family transcriptional regulator
MTTTVPDLRNVHDRGSTMSQTILDALANTPSAADRVYDYLTERLSNGILRGGDVIQESKLAETLELSRTPIRDALGRLEGEGLLVRSGRLLSVRRVTVKEFLDLLHVRRLIEPEAAYLAAGKMDNQLLQELRRQLMSAVERGDPSTFEVDEKIHLEIVRTLRNNYLADLVHNLRRQTRLFELTEWSNTNRLHESRHNDLIDALIENRPEDARHAMVEHLDSLRADVVQRIREL